MEKAFPQNIEAECGVLGSILINPTSYDDIVDIITEVDFYRDAHRIIYASMVRLMERGTPPDFITLCDELERTQKLEHVGGVSAISSLVNEVLTSGNIRYYAEIVAKAAEGRRMIEAAGKIAALGYGLVDNALEQAEQILFGLRRTGARSEFVPLSHIMGEYLKELDYLYDHRGTIIGIPTGYSELDELVGGMQRSDLLILGGRPGLGKTALGLNIAYNAACHYAQHVAIFSLEMGRKQLARRFMSMVSGVDTQRLRTGWFEQDWDRLVSSAGKLGDLPIWINDAVGNPIASMRSQMRHLIHTEGIDLVVVDYLQLIEPSLDGKRRENRVNEISEISRGMKLLAREFDVPVLALASLSRAVETRQVKIPVLADLRDSGGIESDADVVLFVYRDDYYAEMEKRESKRPGIADIVIAKHRNGPTGSVSLYFKADQTKFFNLDERIQS